jgi:hypothetical protein
VATLFVPELGRALGFSAADLEGHLSAGQTMRLRVRLVWYRLLATLASLGLLAGVALWVLSLVVWPPADPFRFALGTALVIALEVLPALAAWYFIGRIRTSWRNVGETRPTSYEGLASAIEVETERSGQLGATLSHFLRCGEAAMPIPSAAYRLIDDGPWRVFYTRSFSLWETWAPGYEYTLLSIEPVSAAPFVRTPRPRPHRSYENAIGFFFLMLILGVIVAFSGTGTAGFLLLAAIGVLGAGLYALMIWRGFVA